MATIERERINFKPPQSFKQALKLVAAKRSAELGHRVTVTAVLIEASLKGDKELSQLYAQERDRTAA